MSDILQTATFQPPDADRHRLTVGIQRDESRCPAMIRGHVVRMTDMTAEIAVHAEMIPAEEVSLAFADPKLGVQLSAAASVHRVQCPSHGNWVVSLSFHDPIAWADLQNLHPAPLIEKRKSPRRPVIGQAMVDWGKGEPPAHVQIKNISVDGFCMLVPEQATIDERFHLIVETIVGNRFVIPAKARWQLESPLGYSIGCEFLYSQGYHVMDAVFPVDSPATPRRDAYSIFSLMLTLLGLLCTALCVYQFII